MKALKIGSVTKPIKKEPKKPNNSKQETNIMPKVSSIEMPSLNTNPIRNNYSSIQHNDMNRSWTSVTIVDLVEKMEKWGYKLAFNLVLPGDKIKNKPKRVMTVLAMSVLLYAFAIKTLVSQLLVGDNNPKLLLMFGDMSHLFGKAVSRVYLNSMFISWGFHAAFVYTLISRSYLFCNSQNSFDLLTID